MEIGEKTMKGLNSKEQINENLKMEIISPIDGLVFAVMKLKEMEFHVEYAKKMGIDDIYCNSYTLEQAMESQYKYETYMLKNKTGNILGFIQLSNFDKANTGNGIFINNLYVEEQYRGRGVATDVLTFLLDRFNEVMFETYYNIPGNKLYQELGFREIGKIYLKTR